MGVHCIVARAPWLGRHLARIRNSSGSLRHYWRFPAPSFPLLRGVEVLRASLGEVPLPPPGLCQGLLAAGAPPLPPPPPPPPLAPPLLPASAALNTLVKARVSGAKGGDGGGGGGGR